MMFRWDGGFIMVSWDGFEEGIEWYTKHFGWECLDKIITPVGKKAFLKMPKVGVVTLKSFDADYEHFYSGGEEGHMRLCFEVGNLDTTLQYFTENEIITSDPVTLPNGRKTFDIFCFENARVTVVENPENDGMFLNARVVGFGEVNSRIGVTDIEKSSMWYEEVLGFKIEVVNLEKGYALVQTEDAYDRNVLKQAFMDNIYLEKIESQNYMEGNPSVRTYFDIRPEEFFEAYNHLVKKGAKPSQIAGDPMKGWGGFHFFDPDGNRINVWSYQMM
ncbi:VOC family protein [Bacillus carboniphilus]